MLFVAVVPPDAVEATTARAAPTRTTAAMMRALMSLSPKRIERRHRSREFPGGRRGSGREGRLLAYTTWPQVGTLAQDIGVVKTTFLHPMTLKSGIRGSMRRACGRVPDRSGLTDAALVLTKRSSQRARPFPASRRAGPRLSSVISL